MSLLAQRFEALRADGRKALIPYITAGDPEPGATVGLLHALVAAGADVLEVGVPFSDPMADGPVIQGACERALAHGTSLRDVLAMVAEFRERDAETPVVLMGYLNPVEAMGLARFAAAAAEAGVDGVLVVDLTAEEAPEVTPVLAEAGLDAVRLIAPTTSEARLATICDQAAGFLYYVSLKGVTGAASLDVGALDARLEAVRRHTTLPVAVGFGVRTPEIAAAVARVADAVVVGSALVARIAELAGQDAARERIEDEVSSLLADMRRAMDATAVSEASE
ncbi:tryptophan synthase subunit alpha [Salinisphaera sp. PC39]|uniref:tryptophan synthase subunit alpha n=1 Tax=Salinisphaera sp. PC39 TaxID=1304156 RepID=UPI003342D054